jgi:hypothetical protein
MKAVAKMVVPSGDHGHYQVKKFTTASGKSYMLRR